MFYFTCSVVLKETLFGIIIDTFGELEEEKKELEEDIKNKCYICNIERHEFDRYGSGFENHIQKDHNLWQYLYFLIYLKNKD